MAPPPLAHYHHHGNTHLGLLQLVMLLPSLLQLFIQLQYLSTGTALHLGRVWGRVWEVWREGVGVWGSVGRMWGRCDGRLFTSTNMYMGQPHTCTLPSPHPHPIPPHTTSHHTLTPLSSSRSVFSCSSVCWFFCSIWSN